MPLPGCCPPASANDNCCLPLTPRQVLTRGGLGGGGRGVGKAQLGNSCSQGWPFNTILSVVTGWR